MDALPVDAMQILLVAALVVVSVVVDIWVLRTFLVLCPPNEVLVLSGSAGGPRLIFGGRVLRKPLIERLDRMRLTAHPVQVRIQGAYSKGSIPLNVEAFALVRVSDDPAMARNAVERFLGRSDTELVQVARETLEGVLRGVIARLTPEEVLADPLKLAQLIREEEGGDMEKLGLSLLVFKAMRVTDDVGHLTSLAEAARAARSQAAGGDA